MTNFKNLILFFIISILHSSLHSSHMYSLDEYIQMSINYSHELQNAVYNEQISNNLKHSAFSNMLPRITSGLSYFRFDKATSFDIHIPSLPVITPPPNPPQIIGYTPEIDTSFILAGKNLTVANITLIQPIFFGGKLHRNYKIASINHESSEIAYSRTKSLVILETIKAYSSYLMANEYLKLSQASESTLAGHADDVRNMVDEGILLENDYSKTSIYLDNARLATIKAFNAKDISKMNLCRLTGLNFDEEIDISDSFPIFSINVVDEMLEKELIIFGINNREDLKIAENQIIMAEENKNIAIARFFPDINFTASISASQPNRDLENRWGTNWMLGINFSYSIFEGGNRIAQVGITKNSALISEENYQNLRELIELEIRINCDAINEAIVQIEISERKLKTANENLSLSRDRFQFGVITNSELLDAYILKSEAEKDLIQAHVNYINAFVQLKASIGALKEENLYDNIPEVIIR